MSDIVKTEGKAIKAPKATKAPAQKSPAPKGPTMQDLMAAIAAQQEQIAALTIALAAKAPPPEPAKVIVEFTAPETPRAAPTASALNGTGHARVIKRGQLPPASPRQNVAPPSVLPQNATKGETVLDMNPEPKLTEEGDFLVFRPGRYNHGFRGFVYYNTKAVGKATWKWDARRKAYIVPRADESILLEGIAKNFPEFSF